MNTSVELSIIIPAFNEAKRLPSTLQSIGTYFQHRNMSYEVIVVDDGSSDDTVVVAQKYGAGRSHFFVLENKVNKGKGYSVNQGMRKAVGKYRLFMDADNSVDISHLDSFLKYLRSGYDVAIGSILMGGSVIEENGPHRRLLGHISKLIIRWCAVPGIYDTQRGFKLFGAKAAEEIFSRQTIWRFGFDIEILVIAKLLKYNIRELPVTWHNPAGSTVTLGSYVRTFEELIRIMINRVRGIYRLPQSR